MKLLVDEMPKDRWECPFATYDWDSMDMICTFNRQVHKCNLDETQPKECARLKVLPKEGS